MKLSELAPSYRAEERAIQRRIRSLQRKLERESDPEEIRCLQRRIRDLQPLQRQCRELAELTAHYYERGYYRNEKYTV